MKKNYNKFIFSIILVFLGVMGMGQTTLDPTKKSIQAWMFPGYPNGITTINTESEFSDGRAIDVIKTEYLSLDTNGFLYDIHENPSDLLNTVNAYSSSNVQFLFNNQNPTIAGNFGGYITISGRGAGLKKLLGHKNANRDPFVAYIKDYLSNTGQFSGSSAHQYITNFKGVELNLELPGEWNKINPYDGTYHTNYQLFQLLINELSVVLHDPTIFPTAKELIITLPVDLDFTWFGLSQNINKYNYLCLMAYDRYYDIKEDNVNNGTFSIYNDFGGVSPTAWVEQKINKVISEMTSANINKIIIGMPSYGYHATTSDFEQDTKKQTSNNPFYGVNPRDPLSHERYFTDNNTGVRWYYQDVIGMCEKVEFIRSKGIKHVSVWHLGGNDWFNRFDINISNNSILDPDYKLPTTCLPASSIVKNTTYSYPSQYYYSTSNKTIDNQNDRNHYAKINSNTGSNTLEFGGYTFTSAPPGNNYVSGFEVVVIGRTENNNSNLDDPLYKSDLFVQLSYNGQDAPPIPFSIYSHHAVCKLFGSTTDLMGLPVITGPINSSFKVKIYHSSGAEAQITAVFVKPYYSSNSPSTPICNYYNTPYNISTVMPVWSNTKLFNNDIVIKSGGVLNITGTVKFTEQAKIIVEPGGQLIVNGGTLTNLCNNMFWKGITVKGHNTQSQFDETKHGKIVLSNNATISNAIYGIQTLRNNDDDTKGGGIILAYNANFINNQTAVKMRKYSNISLNNGNPFIDISTFKNCNFITDNNYITPATIPFQQFINLDNIKGIEIMGCRFKNLSNNIAANYSIAGIGIKSNESYFKIDNFVNQTEFYGLQYGIYASSPINLYGITVKNTIFDQNLHGAYALGMNNIWFTSNEFRVINLENQGDDAQSNAYGLYLENCKKGYTIEGNFFRNIIGSSFNGTNGMIVNNSQSDAKEVYNNTFNNIKYGMLAYQNNGGNISPSYGLTIKCNDFITNYRDIAVTPNNCAGICPTQGADIATDIKSPAGNTFTHLGPSGTPTDFNNRATNNPIYYHHPGTTNDSWVPKYFYNIQPNSIQNPNLTYNKISACPPKAVPNSGTLDPLYINTSRVASRQLLNSAKLIYTIWVDGGNTTALKEAVDLSYPWQAFELYNNLISKSPYLSDEVLIAAIQNEDGLPPLMLKLVLLANPQAVRSNKVMNALYARINPLPEEWIDEIKQGMEVISPRTELEANIGYYTGEYQQYTDILKGYYMADTNEYATDSLIALLSNTTNVSDAYELAMLYLNNDRESEAVELMDNLPNTNLIQTDEELDRYNQTMYYFNICKQLKNNGYENLRPEELEWIITTSEDENAIYNGNAKAIRLKYEEDYQYHEPIFYPEEEEIRMAKRKPVLAIKESLSASPNPANEFTIISYNITDIQLSNAVIEVYDVMGHLLNSVNLKSLSGEQLFNCTTFISGQYLCKLINNGKLISTVKFNVIH